MASDESSGLLAEWRRAGAPGVEPVRLFGRLTATTVNVSVEERWLLVEGAHPLVDLLRRFAVDWLNRADSDVCAEIMVPDYTVHIGGHTLTGRDDAYVPATLGQLQQFPGLLITVHELVTTGEQVALRFTEHGPSTRHGGAAAAWTGIGLFWWDGQRLTRNVTEEDYHARRRQLTTGECDPVQSPAPAPWTAQPHDADPAAEAAVRHWLDTGDLASSGRVLLDDAGTGRPAAPLVDVDAVEVQDLVAAGAQVAFRVTQRGRYAGGLDTDPERVGDTVELSAVGLVTVGPDGTISGHAVRDRAGLRHRLRNPASGVT